MVGIKGVGMTMLAQFLVSKGCLVSGSDTEEVFMTDQTLKKSHIKVFSGFKESNIPTNTDLVIYSTAYNMGNNIELVKVKNMGIEIVSYAEVLGSVFNDYQGLAVIGSHGKTTVSAWLGYVMFKVGLNPNVLVGSRVKQFGGSCLIGESEYLVAEVDEYQNKLQYFKPKMIVLNNIDYDHHDFFKKESDYISAFSNFVKKLPASGFLVANFDDARVVKVSKVSKGKTISYGIYNEQARYIARSIETTSYGQRFSLDGLGFFKIKLLGEHNVLNALAVIVTCLELGVKVDEIRKYLLSFCGTERRLQILGSFNNALVIDDYAHHPSEIKATLCGLRSMYKNRRIIIVFHPHTYTRTLSLLKDFAQSFRETNQLIVLDIYGSAREKQGGVHSLDLVREIGEYNNMEGVRQGVKYIPTLVACEKYLSRYLKPNDVLILMGAGDVFKIGQGLVKKKK